MLTRNRLQFRSVGFTNDSFGQFSVADTVPRSEESLRLLNSIHPTITRDVPGICEWLRAFLHANIVTLSRISGNNGRFWTPSSRVRNQLPGNTGAARLSPWSGPAWRYSAANNGTRSSVRGEKSSRKSGFEFDLEIVIMEVESLATWFEGAR